MKCKENLDCILFVTKQLLNAMLLGEMWYNSPSSRELSPPPLLLPLTMQCVIRLTVYSKRNISTSVRNDVLTS